MHQLNLAKEIGLNIRCVPKLKNLTRQKVFTLNIRPVQAKALQSRSTSETCRKSSSTSACISRPDHHNHNDDNDCHAIGDDDDGGLVHHVTHGIC